MKEKRITVDVDPDTHKIVKLRAHINKMTIREYVFCAIIEKMDRELEYRDRNIVDENDN